MERPTNEMHLFELARQGDKAATNDLCRTHVGLVHIITRSYFRRFRGRIDPDEIWQTGLIGLFGAIRKWKPGRCAFSTFACNRMIWGIRKLLKKHLNAPRAFRLEYDPAVVCDQDTAESDAQHDSGQALALLPRDRRELLERWFGIGRPRETLDQIAATEGRTIETIRQRALRSLAFIRRRFKLRAMRLQPKRDFARAA